MVILPWISGANVTWKPLGGNRSYTYKIEAKSLAENVTLFVIDNSVTLLGLAGGFDYTVSVVASAVGADIPRREQCVESLSATTAHVTIPEVAPTGFVLLNQSRSSENSISLAWQPPALALRGGIITSYMLWLSEGQQSSTSVRVSASKPSLLSNETDSFTFLSLVPATEYTIAVAAQNRIGAGMPLNVTIMTQDDGKLGFSFLF